MRSSSLVLMVCGSLALAACGDDTTGAGGGGGSGGGGTTSGTTSSTSGTPGTTSSSSSSSSSSSASSTASTSSGEQGGGGAGQGGGTGGDGGSGTGGDGGSGTGGDGGSGGGEGGSGGGVGLAVCTDVALVSAASDDDQCLLEGNLALATEGTAQCIDFMDADGPAPLVFYEITVAADDCVGVRADNVGSAGADIWAMIVDPDGNNVVFDDVIACTVGDTFCPEGGLTMGSAGVAYVGVGAYIAGADGCPVGERGAYQVSVNINGTDVSLDAADVCEGDLFEL